MPPAIYKSSCTIDVTYFPFDEQVCEMRFGSWTFDANQVKLVRSKKMANFENYLPSGTWDVIEAPSETIHYIVDGIDRMELIYKFRIRRKTLFYTVNLLIPTVLISFLSLFVFYLPTDEGEKITLSISILLALVVFLVLVSKILPPTSIVIPLIAKYLLFTFIMNILTILNTVIIINFNHRTPRTHNMPKWIRIIFIEFLPKFLLMTRPKSHNFDNYLFSRYVNFIKRETVIQTFHFFFSFFLILYNYSKFEFDLNKKCFPFNNSSLQLNDYLKPCFSRHDILRSNHDDNKPSAVVKDVAKLNNAFNSPLNSKKYKKILQKPLPEFRINDLEKFRKNVQYNNNTDRAKAYKSGGGGGGGDSDKDTTDHEQTTNKSEFSQEISEAANHINFITNHMKTENDYQEVNKLHKLKILKNILKKIHFLFKIKDDWKYVASVIDRLQLLMFFIVTVSGTGYILLKAPYIFEFVDQQECLRRMFEANKQE